MKVAAVSFCCVIYRRKVDLLINNSNGLTATTMSYKGINVGL